MNLVYLQCFQWTIKKYVSDNYFARNPRFKILNEKLMDFQHFWKLWLIGRRVFNFNWLSKNMYHDFRSIIFCDANMVTLLPNRLIILNCAPCWLCFVTFVSLPCLGSKWLSMAIRFTHVCEHKSIEYAKYRQIFYTKKKASTKQSTTEKENKKSYPSKFNRSRGLRGWKWAARDTR